MKSRRLAIPCVVGSAKIQVIDGDRWKTLAVTINAPNPINKEAERLKSLGHANLWKVDTLGYRSPLF